jgi:hypothetical protein
MLGTLPKDLIDVIVGASVTNMCDIYHSLQICLCELCFVCTHMKSYMGTVITGFVLVQIPPQDPNLV